MWEQGLGKLADALLAPLLNRAAGKVYGDPAIKAMAQVLDEAIDRAAAELVPDKQSRAAVAGVLREWPHRVDPRIDTLSPDGLRDAGRILTSGVARWVAAVDTPLGEQVDSGPPLTRLAVHGVDADGLVSTLDRYVRVGIARRAQPGGPLAAVQDRLDAVQRHAANLALHDRTYAELRGLGQRHEARSAYLLHVERIAPPLLRDRDAELAELAVFCTAPDPDPDQMSAPSWYVWWRADAWAGKSALLAHFVLHPPPRVRIVSFFVTARFAGQGDQAGFTEVVLEQLAELLRRPSPAQLGEATRHGHLWRLVEEAAEACRERGERLVLLVDGLDEDRGATTGPDAHSIAALLPVRPVAGLRVIVAGRLDPPLPADVPGDHPLRDPAIVRALARSPYAQVVRNDLERELKRLLDGSAAEQDLLGLVCGAGGGVSGRDLAELTGLPQWKVEDHLTVVTGRTFTRYATDGTGPAVYVLAHEELQQTAVRKLQGTSLDGYRERIHRWAERYAERGWPPDTPRYLLRGYYRLLQELGDLDRMVRHATDPARHDRLLEVTGGDGAAVTEISTAQEAILAQDDPDLTAAARLAMYRDHVAIRNAEIPTRLPSVWAAIGHARRGEALAKAIPDDRRQIDALIAMYETVRATRDHDSAADLLVIAEQAAGSFSDGYSRAYALGKLARSVAVGGDVDRAEALVRLVTDAGRFTREWTELLRTVANIGYHERAEAMARAITDTVRQAEALAKVASAYAGVGDHGRAVAIAESISDPAGRMDAYIRMTQAAAVASRGDHALRWAAEVEALVGSITEPEPGRSALARVVWPLCRVGETARAETLARSIGDPDSQAVALTDVARAFVRAGDHDRAEAVTRSIPPDRGRDRAHQEIARALAEVGDVERAAAVARSVTDRSSQKLAWGYVARAVVAAGDPDRAERIARSIVTDLDGRGYLLGQVAWAVAATGDHRRAEAIGRDIPDAAKRTEFLVDLVRIIAATGAHDQAEALAASLADPRGQADALVHVARAAAAENAHDRAAAAARRAEAAARSVTAPGRAPHMLSAFAWAAAANGDSERGLAVARAVADPSGQTDALVRVAEGLASAGDIERAWEIARLISDPGTRAQAQATVAQTMAESGDPSRAEALARSIEETGAQAASLVAVARGLVRAGEPERAEAVARSIAGSEAQARALADVAMWHARTGEHQRAETVARSITDVREAGFALTEVVRGLVGSSDLDEAEAVARSITDPYALGQALAEVALAQVDSGDPARAEAVARSVPSDDDRERALARLAGGFARTGDYDRAEAVARSINDDREQTYAFAAVAHEAAVAGHWDRAVALARSATDVDYLLAVTARGIAESGDYHSAEAVAHSIGFGEYQASTLAAVARHAARAGDLGRAEAIIHSMTRAGYRERVVVVVVEGLADAGNHAQAEALALSIGYSREQASTLIHLARDAPPRWSRRLLTRASTIADWPTLVHALERQRPDVLAALLDDQLRLLSTESSPAATAGP